MTRRLRLNIRGEGAGGMDSQEAPHEGVDTTMVGITSGAQPRKGVPPARTNQTGIEGAHVP